MTTEPEERAVEAMDLVRCGPAHRLAERFGVSHPTFRRRLVKVTLLLLVTWVPLAILSLISGRAFGDDVSVTFVEDVEVHVRLIIVLPLLELAAVVVAVSLRTQTRHLREMGVIAAKDAPRFHAAQVEAIRLRESALAEGAILIVAYGVSLVLRLLFGFSEGDSSWERTGSAITAAGWWHMLVSLPILYFFMFRWLWVFLIWSRFLYRVSRLDLQLTPTHPDRSGGLGFLGWGLASFATVLMAASSVCSAGFADEILNRGSSLNDLKYHVIVFVVSALVVLHAPLLAFSGQLARCRFRGLLEFGALVWRHDRAFDEKWITNATKIDPASILGSADVQSLADVGIVYEHVDRMWLMPFDTKAFVVLALAALIPMLPLVGTAIPLQEIFSKLGELLI